MTQNIEYTGDIYLYSSGMPNDLIEKAKSKLVNDHGVIASDIRVIEIPEGVPEGSILITIWPHYLSVAKVKKVRAGSIYAPQLFNIDI